MNFIARFCNLVARICKLVCSALTYFLFTYKLLALQ